ncbi:MAG: hypothetical protein EZS28_041735 [Streblomastix strix]|uniref:Serine-threonine/tyrosine-protein kinase catalytic domain-containing protein n=1 Tax=Streblomastix strix TaxID=222440 RepID=A0A5J4TXY6_9EUKA|nr:MAG: hypothetical protein EZS28_041735 [Streblomastix strix]
MSQPQDQLGEVGGQPNNSIIVVQPRIKTDEHRKNLTDYIIVQEIGNGKFSNTYSAFTRKRHKLVCLKEQKDINSNSQENFQTEADLLRDFKTPFIVKCRHKIILKNNQLLTG